MILEWEEDDSGYILTGSSAPATIITAIVLTPEFARLAVTSTSGN